MRTSILVALPIALVAGCSLVVDTSGLSSDPADPASGGLDGGTAETSTSGDGALSSDGSTGSSTDASDGAASECPTGRGPEMVRVKDAFGAFCIDSTEVTQTQFNLFLADATRPKPPNVCAYRTSFGGAMRPADSFPVVDVDWCEAWMFCAWAGKRLCGSRNGTVIKELVTANDPKIDEWHAGCSHSGTTKYPYGGSSSPTTCNTCDRTSSCASGGPLLPVASLPKCVGGYPGLFDMAGNVGEWEDNCAVQGTMPEMDECPPRGYDSASTASGATCDLGTLPALRYRQNRSPRTGIRCCAN
jgi:formylglycine-generating enzyme required for sulfatase activity